MWEVLLILKVTVIKINSGSKTIGAVPTPSTSSYQKIIRKKAVLNFLDYLLYNRAPTNACFLLP